MFFFNLMISSNLFLKKYSVSEIFPACKGERYILDGTNCDSYGILSIKMESLSFEISQKSRIKFRDGRKNYFNLSWTSEDSLEKYQDLLETKKETEVLVILGLGRPWSGDLKFNVKRCYILAVGILTQSK